MTLTPDMDKAATRAARAGVRDLNNGLYEATFQCTRTGPYAIAVSYVGGTAGKPRLQSIAAAQVRGVGGWVWVG